LNCCNEGKEISQVEIPSAEKKRPRKIDEHQGPEQIPAQVAVESRGGHSGGRQVQEGSGQARHFEAEGAKERGRQASAAALRLGHRAANRFHRPCGGQLDVWPQADLEQAGSSCLFQV